MRNQKRKIKTNNILLIVLAGIIILGIIGTAINYDDVPYAPPYDIFNDNQTIFSIDSGNYVADGNDFVNMDITIDHDDGFIYRKAYYWDFAQQKWVLFTFSNQTIGNSNWIRDGATESLSINASNSLQNGENYIVAFSCKKQGGVWKCGCVEENNCDKWMIIVFNVSDIDSPSNGSTGTPLDECNNDSDCNLNQTCINKKCIEKMQGVGTPEDPYVLKNSDHLGIIKNDLDANYILGNNIDMSSVENFEPIGTDANRFTGTLDGQGYVISNMYINFPGKSETGLFGYVSGGMIKNLGLENINITADVDEFGNRGRAGAFIGFNNGGTIENCYATGNIRAGTQSGGLVGLHWNNGLIKNSYSEVNLNVESTVGGIAGEIKESKIENSYSSGTITASDIWNGGITANSERGSISNCFSVSSIHTPSRLSGGVRARDSFGGVSGTYWYDDPNDNVDVCLYKNRGGKCTTITDKTYFYNKNNPPMNGWNFTDIWQENANNLPTLR